MAMLSQNSLLLTQLYKVVLSFSIECLLLKLSTFEFHCVKRLSRLFQCGSRMVERFERWKVKLAVPFLGKRMLIDG